jgi:hypothetical protein
MYFLPPQIKSCDKDMGGERDGVGERYKKRNPINKRNKN